MVETLAQLGDEQVLGLGRVACDLAGEIVLDGSRRLVVRFYFSSIRSRFFCGLMRSSLAPGMPAAASES